VRGVVGLLVSLLIASCVVTPSCTADNQSISLTGSGKLFALTVPDTEFPNAESVASYERSAATAAVIRISWAQCQPNDPGKNTPTYDFSYLDNHPLVKGSKRCIIWLSLSNTWAEKIKSTDQGGYWRLAESFVRELVKHAGSLRISHFVYRLELPPEEVPTYLDSDAVNGLKHVYTAAKSAMPGCTLIVEQPFGIGADAVARVYRAGAKGCFDAIAIRTTQEPCAQINIFQVVAARRELAKYGDENKKLLLLGGCATGGGASVVVSWSNLSHMAEDDLRNILTERDIYDPEWVIGEVFQLPAMPPSNFLAELPSEIPNVKLAAQLTAADPIFNYVVETPYKLTITISNPSQDEIKLGQFTFSLQGNQRTSIEAKAEGDIPNSVAAGSTVKASFTLTLPKECAGRQVTLVSSVDYSVSGKSHTADAWLTIIPTPQYEVTILPFRLILDPRKENGEQVGLSVINHTRELFEGKITLSPYSGIKVKPTEFSTKIDPLGLEGFAFNVSCDKDAVPGHYAVFVDVAGKAKEWQAVDVALLVQKSSGEIKIDGNLDDWEKQGSEIVLRSSSDRKPAGKGLITYDESYLYLAIEATNESESESVSGSAPATLLVGFDPLIDGARSSSGGYREDDHEFLLAVDRRTGPFVRRTQGPAGKTTEIVKTAKFAARVGEKRDVYEVAIPWAELEPMRPTKDSSFAMSVLIQHASQGRSVSAEWGGGLGSTKDPRLFLPVILAE
jgi:hypothetical protein